MMDTHVKDYWSIVTGIIILVIDIIIFLYIFFPEIGLVAALFFCLTAIICLLFLLFVVGVKFILVGMGKGDMIERY